MNSSPNDSEREVLRAKLVLETARLGWKELERHFARGDVIRVAVGTDLIDAALLIAENDTAAAQAWLADGHIARAEMHDAEDYASPRDRLPSGRPSPAASPGCR